ncbi:MAG: dethiobiotin synthase [Lentisphaerae bacterium]|nr:dethiobiotin synthase [Lentisphaerota bacterium]
MCQRRLDLFVTGTDTAVGKTVISAALLSLWHGRGLAAAPMKPIQTGCQRYGRDWVAPDLEVCLRLTGLQPSLAIKRDMAPYCLGPACAPHLAARLARRRIRIDRIERSFQSLCLRYPALVVEGSGGVLVPINERQTILDMMRALALPVVLVARPGLGTLNHTLLTLNVLRQARLTIAGVILNASARQRPGLVERDNRLFIERMGQVPVWGCLPFIEDWSRQAFQDLCRRRLSGALSWQEHGRG